MDQRQAFQKQRGNARRRGIEFSLTYEEWLSIWKKSGKLNKRGRLHGCYVMARFNDKGPYALKNVKIISVTKNQNEMRVGARMTKKQLLNHAKAIAAIWANMTPEEQLARGLAIKNGISVTDRRKRKTFAQARPRNEDGTFV
jgi:histidyl-tRNA synthetase